MKSKFKNVKISGLTVVVPEKEINIYDEAEYYDNSIKKIDRMRKMVGFWKRRVVNDRTVTPADLAYDAALNLIKDLNIDKNSIDALIYICQKPDVLDPSTAYFIHEKLELSKNCIATDVNQGCAGWVFGLYMASQMIESGVHKKVLLLNADIPSADIDPSNRYRAPLFGDAGSATLVEYTEEQENSFYQIDTLSSGFEALILPFGGERLKFYPEKEEDFKLYSELRKEKATLPDGQIVGLMDHYMDGLAVFNFTVNEVPKTIQDLMNFAKINTSEIPVLCLHQANKQIIQAVGQNSGFDLEKVPYEAFENFGNNTMCSIPTALSLLPEETARKNILCCGFGNGLVCASAIINLENTYISKIQNFKKPDYIKTRDEYITYWRNKIQGKI